MGRKNDTISEKVRESNRKRSRIAKNKRTELLGENIDGAWYKLKKMILFDLVKKLELDICYRCNQKIEYVDDFSIEHKVQWVESDYPQKSFYDLENIAFSHEKCNYSNDGKQRFRVYENKSGLRGVTHVKSKKSNCWRAQIKKDRKTYALGYYATREEAGKIYDLKAIEFWGDEAITNKSLGLIDY